MPGMSETTNLIGIGGVLGVLVVADPDEAREPERDAARVALWVAEQKKSVEARV
jgi:hypothetical protein